MQLLSRAKSSRFSSYTSERPCVHYVRHRCRRRVYYSIIAFPTKSILLLLLLCIYIRHYFVVVHTNALRTYTHK